MKVVDCSKDYRPKRPIPIRHKAFTTRALYTGVPTRPIYRSPHALKGFLVARLFLRHIGRGAILQKSARFIDYQTIAR